MTLEILRAIAPILLSWLCWWMILAGLGLLLARACGHRIRTADGFFSAIWSGWTAASVFLMLWHFLLPVDGRAAALVAALGLAGWIVNLRHGRHARDSNKIPFLPLLRHWTPLKATLWLIFWLIAACAADRSLYAAINYDTGFYHIASIQWTRNFAIVPGLGNLHSRLAFNQSFFPFVALLCAPPWGLRAYHWAEGLLLLPLIGQLMARLSNGRGGNPGDDAHVIRRIFSLLMLAPVVTLANGILLSSPSPDLPIFVLGVVLALELLDLLLLSPAATRGLRRRALRLAALAVFGITIKFSMVALSAATAAIALAVVMRRLAAHGKIAEARRLALASAAAALLILTPWAARDVCLSGYIAYPMPYLSVPVAWRLPRADALGDIKLIASYARDPLKNLPWPVHGWRWVWGAWASHMATFNRFGVLTPLGLIAFALLATLVQRRLGITPSRSRVLALFLTPPLIALVFWFFTAPVPRFAGASFWVAAAGANTFVLARFSPARRRLMHLLTALLVAALFFLADRNFSIVAPGADHGFAPDPRPALRTFTTNSGLQLYVPEPGNELCWDAPLPNTPFPKKALRLIVPGNLQKGFMLSQ